MSLVAPPARSRSVAVVPATAVAVRAVVLRGLRDHRRTPLTWGGPLGAMSALMAAMWPSIEGSVHQLLQSYPERLKAAFNICAITSVEGYIDAEMLSLILPLALSFLAVRVVVQMLPGAEETGRLDVVLSAPLARRALALGALGVAAIVVAAVLVVIASLTWVVGTLVGASPSITVLGDGECVAAGHVLRGRGGPRVRPAAPQRAGHGSGRRGAPGHVCGRLGRQAGGPDRASAPALRVQVLRLGGPGRHRSAGLRGADAGRRAAG